MGLKLEAGCLCQAQSRKNPNQTTLPLPLPINWKERDRASLRTGHGSLALADAQTLAVRWTPTPEPLPHPLEHHDRIKTKTLWSLPSRENWNAAEKPSLRHLISEAVRDLADDPLPLAQPPSPPGSTDLQTTCTHQFASGCYFADLDVRKSRLADGGRGPGRAKASTAFETIKHTLTCLKHFVYPPAHHKQASSPSQR